MNKQEFLVELGRHLSVLEDREQTDILEEYAQHIDMKISSGLSEDEAIKDFGDMKELAAEILEAYHVKPEFSGEKAVAWKPDVNKAKAEGQKVYSSGLHFFKELAGGGRTIFGRCLHTSRAIGAGIWRVTKSLGMHTAALLALPFRGRENQNDSDGSPRPAKPAGRNFIITSLSRLMHGIGSTVVWLWYLCLGCAAWCLRLAWNCAALSISVLSGFLTLFLLFALGGLIVLLFDGYPLIGVMLICLGMTLCSTAATVFFFTLLWRRNRKSTEVSVREAELSDIPQEEVQHV